MKLLIFEGLDRCGKDTIINQLAADYPHLIRVHWGFPKGETNEEKTEYQVKTFNAEMAVQGNLRHIYGANYFADGIYIWNRSHIGEYVYGPMYRDSNPDTWIPNLEKRYFANDPDVYLIYLHADVDFILNQDDGKSFTTDRKKKLKEMKLFNEAVDNSLIKNKLKIKVNDGNEYIPIDTICGIIKDAIG